MYLFWVAIISDSVSLFRYPFHNHVHEYSSAMFFFFYLPLKFSFYVLLLRCLLFLLLWSFLFLASLIHAVFIFSLHNWTYFANLIFVMFAILIDPPFLSIASLECTTLCIVINAHFVQYRKCSIHLSTDNVFIHFLKFLPFCFIFFLFSIYLCSFISSCFIESHSSTSKYLQLFFVVNALSVLLHGNSIPSLVFRIC